MEAVGLALDRIEAKIVSVGLRGATDDEIKAVRAAAGRVAAAVDRIAWAKREGMIPETKPVKKRKQSNQKPKSAKKKRRDDSD